MLLQLLGRDGGRVADVLIYHPRLREQRLRCRTLLRILGVNEGKDVCAGEMVWTEYFHTRRKHE